jgi:hypothetical protein
MCENLLVRFTPGVVFLLLLASPALAAGGAIVWAESLDKAIEEAKLRNVPIVAFYLKQDSPSSRKLRGTLSTAKFADTLNEAAVALIGQDKDHAPVKGVDPKTGKEIDVCPQFPGISCDLHARGIAEAGGRFAWVDLPAVFMCKPDGELVHGQDDFKDLSGAAILARLDELQKKLGQAASRTQLRQAESVLAKGDERLEKGKYLDAVKHYEKVSKDAKLSDPLRKVAGARIEALDAKAAALVEAAKAEKDRQAAIVKLRKLAADLKGREVGKAALKAAEELERQGK